MTARWWSGGTTPLTTPQVSTFPHHKHLGGEVQDSPEMDVEAVLAELEGIM
jgi:hypothetical protein